MKKYFLSSILFFVLNSVFAQDNIIFRNGDDIKGKVLEVTDDLVKFKPADNPDGPTYSYKKAEIFLIKYENGKKDIFNEKQNTTPEHPLIYTARPYVDKSGESVFSFMVRAGWEYSHQPQVSNQYYSYPYSWNLTTTENNFYLDILAGRRKKHYQFGAGIGFYFKDIRMHEYYFDNFMAPLDIHSDFQAIGVSFTFSNKIYLLDKKFSPFIMGDGILAFDNIIVVKKGYRDYYANYGYDYYDVTTLPNLEFMIGAGLEIKTIKKYKVQVELGVKLKASESRQYNSHSLFHTGLSLVF